MQNLKLLYRFLSPALRRQLMLTLAGMLAGALAEMMTIGAALSFLLLLTGTREGGLPPELAKMFSVAGGDPIVTASAALITAAILAAALRLWLAWVTGRFAGNVGYEMATRIFSHTLRQPYASFVRQNSSEVLAGVGKIQQLVAGLLLPTLQLIVGVVLASAIGILLFVIHPIVASVVALVVGAAYLLVSVASRRRLKRNSATVAETATLRTKILQEGIGGIRDVILDQSQPVFERQFADAERRFRNAQTDTNFIASAPRFVIEGAGIIALVLVALVMSRGGAGFGEAIPVIGALALGAQRLLPLLQQAYWAHTQMRGNLGMLTDVLALLGQPSTPAQPRVAVAPEETFRTSILFDRVSFEHPSGDFTLGPIDLTIERGSRIGIEGTTGSGKSTFLDLLMGLLDPAAGAIRIDGRPLDESTRPIWQAQIAHVPQTIYLSDDSIAANIAFGVEGGVDDERVRAAASAACLTPFLQTLAEGLSTRVGERGIRLSGGQRQRIGIARALYKGAKVLILDEATSALDDETERAVMQSLADMGDEVTLIMVAHRKSTLAACSRRLRIEKGRLNEV